ncbi:COQ9 family protein [Thalassococcus sp. CAU 1522]|uniref:COQ9 family protein n=1 Tax=Thalassococcus arenae TaxID=2851652 RepID=A0ABS6N7D4_9RHOB|nr:COQ9 family protein [Thalassococcus arenae]MBV2359932.1 COQ9 family protein [Thalassococcus arenae]
MDPDLTNKLLDAVLMHVPFDGWSEAAFRAAIADIGCDPMVARGLFPRGAIDLAVAYHRRGDDAMVAAMKAADLSQMSIRERVTFAVRARLEAVEDREAVRRGTTLFALPTHAAEGARLIWGTADRIWDALGDSSRDINWYTKRATLAGVYSSTVLYWLGDDSPDQQATWAFLDRRIEDVMRIEKIKAQVRRNPGLQKLLAGPNWLLSRVKAPEPRQNDDLPGGWVAPR